MKGQFISSFGYDIVSLYFLSLSFFFFLVFADGFLGTTILWLFFLEHIVFPLLLYELSPPLSSPLLSSPLLPFPSYYSLLLIIFSPLTSSLSLFHSLFWSLFVVSLSVKERWLYLRVSSSPSPTPLLAGKYGKNVESGMKKIHVPKWYLFFLFIFHSYILLIFSNSIFDLWFLIFGFWFWFWFLIFRYFCSFASWTTLFGHITKTKRGEPKVPSSSPLFFLPTFSAHVFIKHWRNWRQVEPLSHLPHIPWFSYDLLPLWLLCWHLTVQLSFISCICKYCPLPTSSPMYVLYFLFSPHFVSLASR